MKEDLQVKVDEKGELYIMRNRGLIAQMCPYSDKPCSDACPLFMEPDKIQDIVFLELCRKTYRVRYENLTDKRKKGNPV